jgi:hypothetical protein
MNLTTYIKNCKDSFTAVTGINAFTTDEMTAVNLNNITYPFVLLLPPSKRSFGKGYNRLGYRTILYLIASKGQKSADEIVTEWNRLEGLINSGLTILKDKNNIINTDGDVTYGYFDESFGGNQLLSVRVEFNMITTNC